MKTSIILLLSILMFPLLSDGKNKPLKRQLANSSHEHVKIEFNEENGPGRIKIFLLPFQKSVGFFWGVSNHGISFICDESDQRRWVCVNDCQMGSITLEFEEGFSNLKLHPYRLNYQSCNPNPRRAPMPIQSSKTKKYKRVFTTPSE